MEENVYGSNQNFLQDREEYYNQAQQEDYPNIIPENLQQDDAHFYPEVTDRKVSQVSGEEFEFESAKGSHE